MEIRESYFALNIKFFFLSGPFIHVNMWIWKKKSDGSRILSRSGATDLHAVTCILYVSESLFSYVLLYVNIVRCISWLTMVYTNAVNVIFGGYKSQQYNV